MTPGFPFDHFKAGDEIGLVQTYAGGRESVTLHVVEKATRANGGTIVVDGRKYDTEGYSRPYSNRSGRLLTPDEARAKIESQRVAGIRGDRDDLIHKLRTRAYLRSDEEFVLRNKLIAILRDEPIPHVLADPVLCTRCEAPIFRTANPCPHCGAREDAR